MARTTIYRFVYIAAVTLIGFCAAPARGSNFFPASDPDVSPDGAFASSTIESGAQLTTEGGVYSLIAGVGLIDFDAATLSSFDVPDAWLAGDSGDMALIGPEATADVFNTVQQLLAQNGSGREDPGPDNLGTAVPNLQPSALTVGRSDVLRPSSLLN